MTENPHLDPLEEEALRRVRARLLDAVRAEQRLARRSRRPLILAVAAAAFLLIAGVAAAVVLPDGAARPARVDVVDDGRPQPTLAPTTSEVPRSSTTSAVTTTTQPLPPRGERPETFVGVTLDGRLLVVDVATGRVVRQLVPSVDEPTDATTTVPSTTAAPTDATTTPPATATTPSTTTTTQAPEPPTGLPATIGPPLQLEDTTEPRITNVAVDAANGLVYYEVCCEPAVGVVWAVPLAGGEPVRVGEGAGPAVSGDGRRFATAVLDHVIVSQRGRSPWIHASTSTDQPTAVANPALAVDGLSVAFEVHDATFGDGGELVVTRTDDRTGSSKRRWRDPAGIGWSHPTYRRDGDVLVVQQTWEDQFSGTGPRAARVVDAHTGKVLDSFQYPTPARDQDYDGTGTW
ncbi:MAG TPA: hypothetical protein VF183_02510, partial [Acidimicrobiales bacterium]